MDNLPFDKPGRFYRGNLHTHSNRSDGTIPPEEVIQAYRDEGYDFLALTDHFLERYGYPITDTREFRTPEFTTLLGAELHAPKLETSSLWHIVAAGLPLDFASPSESETGPELARRAADAGAFIGMAHPAWYGLTMKEAETLEAAHAVEVYNETCVQHNDRGESWYVCDYLIARDRRINAYAADDAHFTKRPDRFGGWVHVRAESLEPEALLDALKAGHYYSSQGPEIADISIDGDRLSVRCSPARQIFVTGRGSAVESSGVSECLTECTVSLNKFNGSYCRVTVLDANGKHAWSNPIWLS